ncbi:MAG: hypothetical protein ABIO70_05020 [Pseudomonadota bacterium]
MSDLLAARSAARRWHLRVAALALGLERFWGDHEHLTSEGCAWVADLFGELILAEPDPGVGGAP